jgi:signal transduction histidine kinase
VRAVLDDLREKAFQARTELRFYSHGDCAGQWDHGRIEQVVLNLVTNAIKYGEGQPVDVELEGGDDKVRLSVRDRGIGVAAEDVDRIFEPFERAAPARHFGGLGLGLYITRRIVESHGGTTQLATQLGKGSTFTVTLPRANQRAAVAANERASISAIATPGGSR